MNIKILSEHILRLRHFHWIKFNFLSDFNLICFNEVQNFHNIIINHSVWKHYVNKFFIQQLKLNKTQVKQKITIFLLLQFSSNYSYWSWCIQYSLFPFRTDHRQQAKCFVSQFIYIYALVFFFFLFLCVCVYFTCIVYILGLNAYAQLSVQFVSMYLLPQGNHSHAHSIQFLEQYLPNCLFIIHWNRLYDIS